MSAPSLASRSRRYKKRRDLLIDRGAWSPYVNPAGSRRRLEALQLSGWSCADAARAAGKSRNRFAQVMKADGRLLRSTADDVSRAFMLLWDQAPPGTPQSVKTRLCAIRRGYLSSLAWDDIDDPSCVPDCPADESVSVATRYGELRTLGLTVRTIATRYGVQPESVLRALDRTA